MFSNFDPKLLERLAFKEDAVRKTIIVPILALQTRLAVRRALPNIPQQL